MPNQSFVNYVIRDRAARARVLSTLLDLGYSATDQTEHMVGDVLQVRIRDDTADRAEVARIVEEHAPDASPMPPTTPTKTLVGYRDGR